MSLWKTSPDWSPNWNEHLRIDSWTYYIFPPDLYQGKKKAKKFWRKFAGGIAYEAIAKYGKPTLEIKEDGTLALKISNQPVVNVPLGCTLLIQNNPVSGVVSLNVEGDNSQSWGALAECNRPDTTDPTRM